MPGLVSDVGNNLPQAHLNIGKNPDHTANNTSNTSIYFYIIFCLLRISCGNFVHLDGLAGHFSEDFTCCRKANVSQFFFVVISPLVKP